MLTNHRPLLACALFLAGTLAAHAQNDVSVSVKLNIDAQPLPAALNQWASQTGYMVLIPTEDGAQDLIAPHIHGAYTPEDGLKLLLAKSGFKYEVVSPHTVSIRPIKEKRREDDRAATASEPGGVARLAQSDTKAAAPSPDIGEVQKPNEDRKNIIQEVIVTAQKREERLVDVPISIVALRGDELQKRQLISLDDLRFAVPGMTMAGNPSNNQIQIRGISNLTGNSPLVGLYLDEADITLNGQLYINPSTYDLERVEVLRGPQGTLYGEGSAGGTIRFIAKNPELNRFGMTSDVSALFTQGGEPGQRINAAINVPLIESELGLRIAGTYDHEGGWIDQPAADRKDINGQNLTNVRVKGLWQPNPQFTVSAMAEIYRNDRGLGVEDVNRDGDYTQVFNLTTTPAIRDEHDIYNLTLTCDLPTVRFLSTTSYVKAINTSRDVGFGSPSGPPPGTPFADFYYPVGTFNNTASIEELRLTSIGARRWQWTVGGFYRHYRDNYNTPTEYFDLRGPPGTPLPLPFAQQQDTLFQSWSAFGDMSYQLSERFTIGGGARYFSDHQEFGASFLQSGLTGKFHSVDPRVYMQYKLTDEVNTYASAAKGFRSGGFNLSPGQPTFGPETVWTYELGTKASLPAGRLSADVSIFYTNYKDFVISGVTSVLANAIPISSNAGDARLEGIEWDLTWKPADRWTLGFNGEYLNTRFTRISLLSTAHIVGDPIDLVPKYQANLSVQHDFKWNGKQWLARLDYSQQGRETYQYRSVGPWFFGKSDIIHMLNYNMSLQWSEGLSLNLFAQNLLNNRSILDPQGTMAINNSGTRTRPRTFGIGFNFTL
jgi:iron complex outermembrane receptor protein